MRRLFVILILGALCFQCMAQLGIRAWFSLNQDYLVQKFCINKDRPELGCQGTCYLSKKLGKAGHQPDANSTKHQPEFNLFLLPEPPAATARLWYSPVCFTSRQDGRRPLVCPEVPFEPPRI
jgi:hypothetical protein